MIKKIQWSTHTGQSFGLYVCLVLLLAVCVTAVLLAHVDYEQKRASFIANLENQTYGLSLYSQTPLKSQHKQNLQAVLNEIAYLEPVKTIRIYDQQQHIFAQSQFQPKQALPGFIKLHKDEHYILDDDVIIVKPIIAESEILGAVVVEASLKGLHSVSFYLHKAVLVLGVWLSATLAIWIYWRVQWIKPLGSLKRLLTHMRESHNYTWSSSEISDQALEGLITHVKALCQDVDHHVRELKDSQQRLHLSLLGSNEIFFDWDFIEGFSFDETISSILGSNPHHIPRELEEYLHIIHPTDLDAFQKALSDHLKDQEAFFKSEHRLKNNQGDFRWVLTKGKVTERDHKGHPKRMTGTMADIQQRKEFEEELKLFYKVFSSTTEAIVVMDSNCRILQCNKAFHQITGYSLEDVKGKSIELLYSDNHSAAFYNSIRYAIENDKAWMGELIQKRVTGETYPTHLSINAMDEPSGLHYVGVFSDLTAQRLKEDKLNYLTKFDPLTGLSNREQIKKALNQYIHLANEAKESFGLIIVGIDNFKMLNDTFGHGIGDEILKIMAGRLKQIVKQTQHLARLGGDEFAIIVPNVRDKEQLEKMAESIIATITRVFHVNENEIILGCCLGISVFPHDGQDMDTMIINADTAMVQAKKYQRNSYQFFVQSMNEQVIERHRLESMLRKAIENEELKLYYQPKVDVCSAQVRGAEALIRWEDEQEGCIPPEKFVPIAEASGLIVPMGEWILRQACMQGQLWHSMGWHDFTMAINVSPEQLKHKEFIDTVVKVLHETGFAPSCLELEVTEGAIMNDMLVCQDLLEQLKQIGIKIAIDDFGTGYSSLSYIKQLPVDVLKIDKSFVYKMTSSPEDAHIVAAILSMAKGLNLKTVAEGVESLEQVSELRTLGCDIIQGFYYSKPITASEFENFYLEQNLSSSKNVS